ncbi:MAG: EVE domain-containing protein [Rhodanobacter sp. 68-29]|uniref:EVE domain-containing protein n=1 Tax=Rhodanobacter sp. PCA2 TaxID=2006117 RepID=UPI00086C106C|nr:EVE domain-containing protein [Rhodanobacter sp. PCA2]MBA2079590.1 EVE domain-containing protein [Rhodanobacter sp. PCA2]MBN8923074.1 EVE domain-containing protein [Rhodanobacter sp.]ODU75309.1 MAG: EVE domain-containing protein [Rhodanobacter sp. SCN 69-32]OJY58533.1 MAG: EVE domain-containing protein [Rhodanobacter sp. 68-29]
MSPRPRHYWLMKSEPDTFSIDDLKRKKQEAWDGVRNYQARNHMRDGMRVGDKVFFYHSSCAEPGIVGIAAVATDAYPDPSQFDPRSKYFDPGSTRDNPRWMLVDVKFVKKLKRTITLKELQGDATLDGMVLLRKGSRLSVQPVEAAHWEHIVGLE